ncbi:alanine--tRNA ligase [archaeon]|jgi:alanyl-tRNA synthetase|nr:alanine--tRNA ligase [archaeon]MBT4241795.1 alanine--tRNA ligase [archaeon]MBT4418343.1 alanine--tRNA ligase [archaeon]
MKINREQLIEKYIEFLKSKKHKEIQNSSLIPENDPTVLFTTAGMHPLVPYLLGQPHPQGKKLVNVQRCIRTGDIEEVGDTTHHTFFEMLGNWSLGDYFKKEAIEYSFEFLTKTLKIPIERLAVSVFSGDKNAPRDNEASEIWINLGISKERIAFLNKKENWWGPAGNTGPCGPDTEIFYCASKENPPKKYNPQDNNWVEIGNNVLMQYVKDEKGKYNEAKQKNIDFGGGVERILAVLNNHEDNYQTEIWKPIIEEIEKLSKKNYKGNEKPMRIIADHIKASVFIIADGITPSNLEQGYVLRRLIRRAIRYGKRLGISPDADLTTPLVKIIIKIYSGTYSHLKKNKEKIINELNLEENKFEKTLDKGLKEFKKMSLNKQISNKEAFLLFQSYGFPIEMTKELAKEKSIKVDEKGFQKELEKHQELSRTATAGKFKSGLADKGEETTKLHTAAHLLLAAIRKTLGNDINQRGSNITSERLRFDFNFDRKLTDEEKKKIEDLVNKKIQEKLEVKQEEMTLKQAKEKGATGAFDNKYGNKVTVYTIKGFSKELCAGPHVTNTSKLGKFKIKKEQSSSSGVRRIKAELI